MSIRKVIVAFDALNRSVSITDLPYTYRHPTPVLVDDLILIRFIHWDFNGKDKVGQIVLHRNITGAFIEIMKIAYDIQYPLTQAVILDDVAIKGNYRLSLETNNTSGFHSGKDASGMGLSKHAYGLAIDLNPRINPMVINEKLVFPSNSNTFVDNSVYHSGRLHETHDIVLAFMERGFEWHGFLDTPNFHRFEFSDIP